MYCSIKQALHLWDELRNAYEGKSTYGGFLTEIYAYTLMQCHPSCNYDRLDYQMAAQTLVGIIDIFCETYTDRRFLIDELPPKDWLELHGHQFDHRVEVESVINANLR
jgi:hypothetical protein